MSETLPNRPSKRRYTSPRQRDPNAFRFRLTERDLEILRAVKKYHYLNVNLIHKLLFPPETSKQVCSRRVKKLYHAGYLNRVLPYHQGTSGSAACAYCLDRQGITLLQELGEDVKLYNRASQKNPLFLNHAIAVSEFGIIMEQALAQHPQFYLHHIVFDFEVKTHLDQAIGLDRFRLYSKLVHPLTNQSYVCYPDILLVIRRRGVPQHSGKLILVEIDRGTMGPGALRDKVMGYSLYHQQGVFKKFGKFSSFRVLFQTASPKRVEALRQAFTDLQDCDLIWVTDLGQVRAHEADILTAPIWLNADWRTISIVKPDGGDKGISRL